MCAPGVRSSWSPGLGGVSGAQPAGPHLGQEGVRHEVSHSIRGGTHAWLTSPGGWACVPRGRQETGQRADGTRAARLEPVSEQRSGPWAGSCGGALAGGLVVRKGAGEGTENQCLCWPGLTTSKQALPL